MNKKRFEIFSIFFPFWMIITGGLDWMFASVAVSLVLDGAMLLPVLMLSGEDDPGGIWKKTFLSVFCTGLAGSAVSGTVLYLFITFLPLASNADCAYYLKIASTKPWLDLRVIAAEAVAIVCGVAVMYLLNSRISFKRLMARRSCALAISLLCAPYALLFPNSFGM